VPRKAKMAGLSKHPANIKVFCEGIK